MDGIIKKKNVKKIEDILKESGPYMQTFVSLKEIQGFYLPKGGEDYLITLEGDGKTGVYKAKIYRKGE